MSPYLTPAQRNVSGNVNAKPAGVMKSWTRAECGATWQADTLAGRRRALDRHWWQTHSKEAA